jgi:hypothetical protein
VRKLNRNQAIRAVQAEGVPDDASLPFVTVIGPPEARKAAVDALRADPEAAKHFRIKEYSPDAWQVQGAGFKTDGSPTIYVQAADGKVIHRQDNFKGGMDGLKGALRKANPNYKPQNDPGPNSGGGQPLLDAARQVPVWAWLLGGVGVAFLALSRNNDKKGR